MIDNALKTLLGKENYKRIKDKKDKRYYLELYHRLGRDKEKFNRAIEVLLNGDEVTESIDKAIEYHKEAIKRLERVKRGYIFNKGIGYGSNNTNKDL